MSLMLKPSNKRRLHLFNYRIYSFSVISQDYLQLLHLLLFTVVPLTLTHPLNMMSGRSHEHSLGNPCKTIYEVHEQYDKEEVLGKTQWDSTSFNSYLHRPQNVNSKPTKLFT